MTRRGVSPVVAVLVVAVAVGAALLVGRSALKAAGTPAPVTTRWTYANEQSWIVGDTLGAIAATGAFARGEAPPAAVSVSETRPAPAGRAAFAVAGIAGPPTLTIREHVFEPDAYVPFAAAALTLGAATGSADPALPGRLTDLRLEVLHAASVSVSNTLTRAPRSAGSHADAALVLAAFAFREAAAGHTDPRHEMTRIAAHLAMEQALRGTAPEPVSARIAHLTLLMLAGRMADVVERLDRLPATTDAGELAWRRALRMRATDDWRAYRWEDAGTLLERFAWYRAVRVRVDTDGIYRRLATLPEPERMLPDWGRMTLTGGISVQDCHSYAIDAAGYDIQEAMRGAELFRAEPVGLDEIVAALNDEPAAGGVVTSARGARLEVLEWGRLAAFLQRHVGARLSYEIGCVDDMLGMPEQVPAYFARQEATYGDLRLFALEGHRFAKTAADYERWARPAAELLARRPELVTPHHWSLLHTVPAFTRRPPPVGPPSLWFDPASPVGTAFENGHGQARTTGHHGDAVLGELIRLNPFNTEFRWTSMYQRAGGEPSYAALVEGYGPAVEWDLRSMHALTRAAAKGSPARKEWLQKRCDADVDDCSDLAEFFREAGDEEQAAAIYRRYWKEAWNRVAVSNAVDWLVEYLETHGRGAEAEEIARDAFGVGSEGGFVTLAWLHEKRGRWAEAEKLHRRSYERYGDPTKLYEFYTRGMAAGQEAFAAARRGLVAERFPGGQQKMAAPPDDPPTAGAAIYHLEDAAKVAGLAEGDVIVALDGVAVRDAAQFSMLRLSGTDPTMRFLVYRNGAYRELTGSFPERRVPIWVEPFPVRR